MVDNKRLFQEIENRALLKARAFKRILVEYKQLYDQLYYTCSGLSRLQHAALYNKAYKLLKKDVKQLNKIEKKIRKEEREKK